MSTEILLAPVGTGKTDDALDRLSQTLDDQPLAQVWVLVSGKRQEDAFRQRLVERYDGRRVYFNVEFFTFYQLYHRLLNIARQPPRMLDDAARFGLLRAILADLQTRGELTVFAAIATTPGFVGIIADFIYELKQNLVYPHHFVEAAQSLKDRELADIYATYQDWLQGDEGKDALVDREGEGWLALDVLREERFHPIGREVDLLLVDGYDQFTPLQASLLMLVAARAKNTLITLATVPGRAETVGRRFIEALDQLTVHSVEPPLVTTRPDRNANSRPPALQHLVDDIFRRDAQQHAAGNQVALIEAPDPAQEAGVVMRRVKRLLLETDAQPDDMLIALRDWPRYAGHLAALGRAYGVPLALHLGEPLNQNPALIMLLNLLGLHEHDFRRRDLLDVLRSPYFRVPGIEREQIDQLEAISQRLLVTGGRTAWLDAVDRAARPIASGEDHDDDDALLLDTAQVDHLYEHLARFFAQATPPPQASLSQYVRWLGDLIGPDTLDDPDDENEVELSDYRLHMPAQIRQGSAPGIEDRDRAALDELMRLLRSLLAAEDLLSTLGAGRVMTRDLFLLELRTAVDNTAINRSPLRNGQVLVTTVTDARGLPHRHVFIPGLSEGIFPVPPPEDPLYLDSERELLREHGIRLETQAERAADDGLFYELVGLARETLTLSRPTAQDGAPWLPSHLWRAVMAVLSDADDIIQRVQPGAVVAASEVASVDEALLAVADGLNKRVVPFGLPELYNWLLGQHCAPWGRINHARQIEMQRLARRLAHDRYSGRLSDPTLIAWAAAQLGPERMWSASQLNDYGVCGFRFFAKRLLKLDALEEPEEGLNVAKLGTINHEILEGTYRELGERGLGIVPENLDDALAILRDQAGAILDAAPQQLSFAADALWEQEQAVLVRRLEALVRNDFSGQSPVTKRLIVGERYPYFQEAPFSTDGGVPVSIPIDIDGQTEALHVRGYIDRMDRVGDQIILVDYKSGTTPIPVEAMREGRNFQMMLYLRAAEIILAAIEPTATVAGGLFWHIRNQKPSGVIKMNDEGREALEEAEEHIGRYIAAGRRGDFTVQPRKLDNGRCVRYCEFSQLCRVASTSRYKGDA